MYVFFGTLKFEAVSLCILLVFLEVKSPQEHLPSALAIFTPLKHSTSLSAMFVYIRVPPNNPINARVSSLGLRLSLFSEVSYVNIFGNLSERYPFSTKLLPRDHHVVVLRQAAFQD